MAVKAIREYLLNASFHGVRYLAEKDRHWSERLFWFTCCILSWIASWLLMKESWHDFKNNAISFVVETNYLDWDTRFPSVSVCEISNEESIADTSDMLFGDPHDYNLDEMINELVFYKGIFYYTVQLCGPDAVPNSQCVASNFSAFESFVRKPCSKLFIKCMWNQIEFDCCSFFSKLDTELGTCYSINSFQAKEKKMKYKMVSNFRSGPGTLYLEMSGITTVYLLSQYDVPSLMSSQADVLQASPRTHIRRYISLKEIDNQPQVKDVSIDQRQCRFPSESNLDVYKYYSYNACIVQCRKEAQLNICNCTQHYMPNTDFTKKCDINGIECLSRHYNQLTVLKAYWSNRSGLLCSCLPSCVDIEMTTIKDEKFGIYEDNSIVEIALERLPTERFKRNVVRDQLDLVVSMGGSVGLFVGASLLSFVEIVYYFTLRMTNVEREKNENGQDKPRTASVGTS